MPPATAQTNSFLAATRALLPRSHFRICRARQHIGVVSTRRACGRGMPWFGAIALIEIFGIADEQRVFSSIYRPNSGRQFSRAVGRYIQGLAHGQYQAHARIFPMARRAVCEEAPPFLPQGIRAHMIYRHGRTFRPASGRNTRTRGHRRRLSAHVKRTYRV